MFYFTGTYTLPLIYEEVIPILFSPSLLFLNDFPLGVLSTPKIEKYFYHSPSKKEVYPLNIYVR